MSRCNFVKAALFWKANRRSQNLFPFGKMVVNNGSLPVLLYLTLLHSEQSKLYGVLAVLSAIGLKVVSVVV